MPPIPETTHEESVPDPISEALDRLRALEEEYDDACWACICNQESEDTINSEDWQNLLMQFEKGIQNSYDFYTLGCTLFQFFKTKIQPQLEAAAQLAAEMERDIGGEFSPEPTSIKVPHMSAYKLMNHLLNHTASVRVRSAVLLKVVANATNVVSKYQLVFRSKDGKMEVSQQGLTQLQRLVDMEKKISQAASDGTHGKEKYGIEKTNTLQLSMLSFREPRTERPTRKW